MLELASRGFRNPLDELARVDSLAELAGAVERLAPLETYVCGDCGYAEWFAVATPPLTDRARGIHPIDDPRRSMRCAQCGPNAHHLVARLHETNAAGAVSWPVDQLGGYFSCTVCDGCGKLEWYASTWARDAEPAGACRRCGDPSLERLALEQVNLAFSDYPVAMIDGEAIGSFRIRVCGSCGFTDWYASGIDRERADDHCRIERAGAALTAARGSDGGPYR
jgi:hypothetical protein